MSVKYQFRRVSPTEFSALMRRGSINVNDFLFITGRRREQVLRFLTEGAGKASWTPTMGDVLILELCARDPAMIDTLTAIANEYSER